MAAAFLRRSAATAGLAVLATMASPLVGSAFAAGFSGSIGSDPAADSNGVVAATRPTFSANFSAALASGSTISVKQGSTDIACPASIVSNVISCQPTGDLVDGKTYTVTSHGVEKADPSVTADAPSKNFVVDIPSVVSSVPSFEGAVLKADSKNPLSVTLDQAISKTGSSLSVVNGDGDSLSGDTTYTSSSGPLGSADTISFAPSQALGDGHYTAMVHVDGVNASGNDNPAAYVAKTFGFWVASGMPAVTSHDPYITSSNKSAVEFKGTAAPGLGVTVNIPNTHGVTGGTGSTTVAACDAAPACPWTVHVDASSLSQDDNYAWSAHTTDGNGNSSPTTDGSMIMDTTAPNAPTVTAPSPSAGSTTLHVSATDTSTDVAGYHVVVTDGAGSTPVAHDYTQSNGNLPDTAIDISTLADGTLTVVVSAVDYAGNAKPTTVHPVKAEGLKENFSADRFQIDGQDVTFTTAMQHAIRKPSQIKVEFTQPIRINWQDASGTNGVSPVEHPSSVCVHRVGSGVCLGSNLRLSDDSRGFLLDISGIGNDGNFQIDYANIWPAAFCPDLPTGPAKTKDANCVPLSGSVKQPASAATFVFPIDQTAPLAATLSMPSEILAGGVHTVGITGTAPCATAGVVNCEQGDVVTLQVQSTGGGPTFILADNPVVDRNGHWSTVADLSTVRDGTLDVVATIHDAAGNASPGASPSPSPVLAAHATRLTESVSGTTVTYGKAVLVTGKLVDQTGAPISGAAISVKPRFDDGTFGPAQTATTNGTGHWSLTEFPAHNATWSASYAGSTVSPVQDASPVQSARTLVKVAIAFTAPKNKAKVGSPVVLKGKVSPNKQGRAVSIYRHTSSGNTLVGRATLSPRSTWAFSLRLPHGTFTLFAVIGKTTGNLGNRTRYLTITH